MATPEEQEKNTSLASAFSYALDQPLENIGTTLDAMGFDCLLYTSPSPRD